MKRIFTTYVMVLMLICTVGLVSAEEVRYGGMVRIAGQWGSLTNNFNPFLASGQNAPGTRSALYETIFFVSPLDGAITPVLGTAYQWEDNNLKLIIETRQGVKWSDGTPFTANDVVFTFNYMKKHPALDLNGIWANDVTKVEALTDHKVQITFAKPNTPLFRYIAHTLIVPEHIWSEIEEPSTFTNANPVVTGPFVKGQFSSQAVIYQRNATYWMEDKPYLDSVAYQAAKSNDTALLLLLRKKIDYSHLFIPDPEKALVAKDPTNNKYWWSVTNTNILYLNTSKELFTDVAFRQALAYATDKEPLSEKAYYGVIAPAHPTGIIPGQQPQWVNQALAGQFYSYDLEKAKDILSKAGYSWDGSGSLFDPSGKKVPPVRILVGAGWTDFISMAQLISKSVKGIGIEMVIEQEPWSSYINSLMGGTYDTAICWGSGSGSTPYDLYYRTLESTFAGLDDGIAESNYSRYSSPVIDAALAKFRASSDLTVQQEAISTIQQLVIADVPYIPLTNRANFNDYQISRIVGWPDAENPYNGGDPGDELGGRLMLLNIRLK